MSWKFAPIFAENAHLHLCFLSYGICAVANISSVMILGGKEGEQEYNGSRNSECSQLESEVIFCMTMDFVFNSNLIQWTDLRLRGRLGRFYQKVDISLRVPSLLHFFCYWWRLCWQKLWGWSLLELKSTPSHSHFTQAAKKWEKCDRNCDTHARQI